MINISPNIYRLGLLFICCNVLISAASLSADGQSKSTPIFRSSNGYYTVNVKVGTPAQSVEVALSHLQDPFLVSSACGEQCVGRTLYNVATSSSESVSNDGKNLTSDFGQFNGTQSVTDQTEVAGKRQSSKWKLASSTVLPQGTTFAGILPVTGTNFLSIESLALATPSKQFAINFARDNEQVGTGRLWIGARDPNIPIDSITYFNVLRFQGFSMLRFTEGQIGNTTLNCKVGPKTDCDATFNLASNFSTLGRNIDGVAESLGLTKIGNKYIVQCNQINQLPNVTLKVNNQRLTFTPDQYVVKNTTGSSSNQKCYFGFVSSNLKDFRLGLNLLRNLYIIYKENSEPGSSNNMQIGFYNVNSN